MSRRVVVVTGTRAEFGLLHPVMRAIEAHPELELHVVVTGAHLLPRDGADGTWREVAEAFPISAQVEMQIAADSGRAADARATGRGIVGLTDAFARLDPAWVVVLGDRIEALAAAAAASIAGFAVAQVHAGDRAEGVADEAMRHAITKLAHLHFAATDASRQRVIRMGERVETVLNVGSPAVDLLEDVEPLADGAFTDLGAPRIVVLQHPVGAGFDLEAVWARRILDAIADHPALWLHPNHDADREGILSVIREASLREGVKVADHLPRPAFVALLRRLADSGGVLVGNSSAGLIEAGVLRCPAVNIGVRQAGRERPSHVVNCIGDDEREIAEAIEQARRLDRATFTHPYGDGRASQRIAAALADEVLSPRSLLRKQCTY